RFCGYAEAVAGHPRAREGLSMVWASHACGSARSAQSFGAALKDHRALIFGQRASDTGISEISREKALKVLEQEDAQLPRATVLRCRVRYFTDGAILGSQEFVRSYVGAWQLEKKRKYPPKPNLLRGADWHGLATINGLRKQVFD
ncbi:MAG: transposase, partial [Opitutales bacterium]